MNLSEFRYYPNKKEADLKNSQWVGYLFRKTGMEDGRWGGVATFPPISQEGFSVAAEDQVRGNRFRLKGGG